MFSFIFCGHFSYHQKYLLQKYPHILVDLDMEPGEPLKHSYAAARINGYVGGYSSVENWKKECPNLDLPATIEAAVTKILTGKSGLNIAC